MRNQNPPGGNRPATPLRCMSCGEVITGDGYTIPAVHPFRESAICPVIIYRAAYHPDCLPVIHRPAPAVVTVA